MTSPSTRTRRKRISAQDRARLFTERGGRCSICQRKLLPGDRWVLERIIALENGGSNGEDNLSVTCFWCAREKTADDHGKTAKSRRVRTQHVVPKAVRQPRRGFRGWRQFDGSLAWRGK